MSLANHTWDLQITPLFKARWLALLVWACTACAPPAQSESAPTDAVDGFSFVDAAGSLKDSASATDVFDAQPSDVAQDTPAGDAQASDLTSDLATTEDAPEVAADSATADGAPTPDTSPSTCADNEKLCPQTFVWAAQGDEASVEVRGSWNGWKAGALLQLASGTWTATLKLPQGQDFQYKFRIVTSGGQEKWLADPGNAQQVDDGFGGKNSLLSGLSCTTDGVCPVPQTICGAPLKPGAFDWRDAVLYFVFVDRFANGDPSNDKPATASGLAPIVNWHGGDWQGVTDKIKAGYFKDLGVNALWLTVPLDNTDAIESGDDGQSYTAYHGYWPRNVDQPNAHFGTMADLKALVDAAHAQGIQVVLDYAMNHVHKSSPLFINHPEWFHPLNVNGQTCTCGAGVCPWDGPSGVWCWFRDYLPDFNFNNADARKASIDNVIWWLEQSGADGLRLDAIKHVEGAWLTELRARLNAELEPKRGQHIWLVGETYTGDKGFIQSFVDPCAKLDGQFDFPLRAILDQTLLLRQGSVKDLEAFFANNDAYYGPDAVMSTFIGNHDLPRVIHYAEDPPVFGDVWDVGKAKSFANLPNLPSGKAAFERIFVAMTVLMGSPGVPLIYYGDEIGLPGGGDPDNRRPMQWTGLGANQQWLLERHQALGQIRKQHSALRRGTRQSLWSTQDGWLWAMTDATETVYVAIHRGDGDTVLGGLPAGQTLTDLLSGEQVTGPQVSMGPRSARILVAP